jgi:ABC-type molybdate transport system substrate-binding protein
VQQEVIFTASVAANAKAPEAATALISFLKTPEAVALLNARGTTAG